MPSYGQIEELIKSSYTTTTWPTMNGVKGMKLTSKSNGNSIFLPAAGYRSETSLVFAGNHGYYLSRSLTSSGTYSVYDLGFFYSSPSTISTYSGKRCVGHSVRPVRVKK